MSMIVTLELNNTEATLTAPAARLSPGHTQTAGELEADQSPHAINTH